MKKVYVKGFIKGTSMAFFVTYLFYRHLSICLLLAIFYGIGYMFYEKKEFVKQQEYELTLEFREGLQGISAALGAGYSVENALGEARKDLELLYGKESLLVGEFIRMERQLALNQPIEEVFSGFAKRWKSEDIRYFAKVFETAKRTGGDLIAITRLAADKISEKIEVRREIYTIISGKKMEGKIMTLIPLGMILYFWISSPGFLDCLYQGMGRIVMSALLLLYLAAFFWSRKISDISV